MNGTKQKMKFCNSKNTMEAAFFGDLALNDHKSLDEAVHLVVGGSLCL